ncbi:VOC family protein [Actinomadura rifamycini]|uniref:VOC family protein n=1 Tax=Actinomadura rifamycini TaxID=31962 RepID=UPI00041855AD|nr:VOC family protein [Actinomadura rifamycini]
MAIPAFNTVAWFQIGTDAPDAARRFYGDMFGWRFDADPGSAFPGSEGYDLVRYAGADAPSGGLSHEPGAGGAHALFVVMVEDVDAACARAEECGGKVAAATAATARGLRFAYLEDPSGNRFGVFTPPAP